MKKIAFLCLFLCCFVFSGCINQKLGENESFYNGELTISGVGPEISFESTIEDGTLALRGSFEDHADHVFFNEGLWEQYFQKDSDCLPGNTVKFKGVVEFIDGAAGNHYYNVKSIDKLEVVKYPDDKEIKEIFEGYNYCESDSDCGYFAGECPLGCYITLNVKYMDIASCIVGNFVNNLGDDRCVYGCLAANKSVCNKYKCEMINADDNADDNTDIHIKCTPEKKAAENCNMIYQPVCGSDSKTYGNSCTACQSETVDSYTNGECM